MTYRSCRAQAGFSLIETIAVMLLVVISLGIAIINLRDLSNPLENGTAQLTGFFKRVRAKAISATSAYIIAPTSSTHIATSKGSSCTDPAPVNDSQVSLDLPSGAHLIDTAWTLCFDSRGLPDANIIIDLQDNTYDSETIEVLLGGAVRVHDYGGY